MMYKKGNNDLLSPKYARLAIVGHRDSSTDDRMTAYEFARRLVDEGYIVVSGLAYGIDTMAHMGGLKRTIAVVTNINDIYPKENTILAKEILDNNGLLLAPDNKNKSYRYDFFDRDRLMVDISDRVYVIGDQNSGGTGYTATYAKKQGKLVDSE